MTNAVVQNSDNSQDISLSILLTNNKSDNLQIKQNDNFSNLLNNLSARTQKAQTNFVQKAVKSNTSSINKKALNTSGEESSVMDKSQTDVKKVKINQNENQDRPIGNVQDKKSVKNTKETKDIKNIKDIHASQESETKNVLNNEISDNVEIKDNINKTIQTETNKKAESQSEINNSSLVESSPVFLVEDNVQLKDDTDLSEKSENIVSILPLPIVSQNQVQIDDMVKKTGDMLSQVETIDDITNVIENISDMLDNSSLSQDEKNSTYDLLNKIQTSLKNNSLNFDTLQNMLQDIVVEFDKLQQNSVDFMNNAENIADFSVDDEFSKLNKIFDNLKDILNSQDIKKVDEAIKKIDKMQEILISDTEKLPDITDDMKISIEGLKKIFDDIKNVLQQNNLDIQDTKESLSNILDSLKSSLTSDIEFDSFSKESISGDFLDNLLQLDEKIGEIDFSKIDNVSQIDKDLVKDILDIFNDLQNNFDSFELDDDIKTNIKDVIEQLDSYCNFESKEDFSVDDFKKINEKIIQIQTELNNEVKNVQDVVKNVYDKVKVADVDDSVLTSNNQKFELNDLQNQTNVVDVADTFENLGYNSEFSNNEYKKNDTNQYKNENLKLSNISGDDFVETQEVFVEKSYKSDTKVELEQKQKFINEIKEDILLDIDYGILPEKSGALSVSDEVIKFAMDDVGVLKTDTTIKGSLLYDSASGNASVIKNVAQMIKTTQAAQNSVLNQLENSDLMNQIGDKLTQLKDNNGQKLTMVLRPNDLGRLSIELTSNNLGLTTNILAQNEDVRQYIEKNIHTLRQQLTDAGISVNNIQIKTAGQEGSTNYHGNQGFEQNNNNGHGGQNNSSNNSEQNEKQKQETLLAMSNYDYRFAKDFSSVMNKTMGYDLN